MKNNIFFKLPALLFYLLLLLTPLYAADTTGGHRGSITSLIHNTDTIISAGEDGFIVIWKTNEGTAPERFQLTPYSITGMAKHPQAEQICIIESAGIGDYRISAWDYKNKTKLFTLRSSEQVTYINYSAAGSFIIACGYNGSPLSLIDSAAGRVRTPQTPEGNITLAITGRNERNMLVYQSDHDYFASVEKSGLIFYLDMETLSVTSRFQAPGNLLNPVIFGNNRFLAGLNADGLIIVDAATGAIYDIMDNIERSALLYSTGDGFYCLSQNNNTPVLYRFAINSRGNLSIDMRIPITSGGFKISLFAYNGGAAFASSDGRVLLIDRQNSVYPLSLNFQARITEIAHTESYIAFLSENNELGFLPTDYRLIQDRFNLALKTKNGYSRITALYAQERDKFLLWQSYNTQYAPRIVYANKDADEASLIFPSRFPLRSVSSRDNKILALDTSGNSYIYSTDNPGERARFIFSSIGAIDAAFVNGDNFLISRSAISGNSPFLYVNINTGETVPYLHNADAGIMSYTGKSGSIYAAAAERSPDGIKTTVLNLYAAARRSASVTVFQYPGEDLFLSIAESGASLAITCGNEGAAIYGENVIRFERTEGLPQILLGSDNFFISLDSEGSISWHDNRTGKLLAIFRLYENTWTLSSTREISGLLSR